MNVIDILAKKSPPPDFAPAVRTFEQQMLEEPSGSATAELRWVLSAIAAATRVIAAEVARIGINDLRGSLGTVNGHGEVVQKMDRFADQTLLRCLGNSEAVGILVSEENQEAVLGKNGRGRYVVLFDPLDGSSNLDCNVATGTIFSVFEREPGTRFDPGRADDILQVGRRQVAAGYVLYSSSTVMVYTIGHGVNLFTLDPSMGSFVLCQENVQMPLSAKVYSCNEGNSAAFPPAIRRYLDWVKTPSVGPYTGRYVGSLVADFHRTLTKGGIFLYPPTEKQPRGKLRLLYEANPLAFLAEQAGGLALDGQRWILDKEPRNLHERTPLYIGSIEEVRHLSEFIVGRAPWSVS